MDFLMIIMASGIARGARTHDDDGDDDNDDGVAQDGCHTQNNRLTETCSLSSLILDTHVMVN